MSCPIRRGHSQNSSQWWSCCCQLRETVKYDVQVELNTIASSFGPLSAVVSRMHEYTVSRCGRSDMVG